MLPFFVKLFSVKYGIEAYEIVTSTDATAAASAALTTRGASYAVEFTYPLVPVPFLTV